MIRVPPDVYLDRRQPDWLDAEMTGRVRYDAPERLVYVSDATIAALLARTTWP